MKYTRLVLVALTLSLAACGSDITGPESAPQPTAPSFDDGWGTLGSGTL
jgi:hypothetical protein